MKKFPILKKVATEDNLLVDLRLHDFPVALLTEFTQKIVCPYYHGNLNQAVKDLMEKAITEQELLLNHVKKTDFTIK